MQEMYELNLGLIRGCRVISILLTIGIFPSYTDSVYHEELVNLHKGIERFDEETSSNPFDKGTSNNHFHEENEISGMLNDLQTMIEHEEETE